MNFSIPIPNYPDPGCGGVCALYQLADALTQYGDVEVVVCFDKMLRGYSPARSDAIAILAEHYGPLAWPRTVRWMLNLPSYVGNADWYANDSMVWLWNESYRYPAPQGIEGVFFTVDLRRNVFYDRRQKRSGTCHLVRKGAAKPRLPETTGTLCIDDYASRGGDAYLADVFNRHETFVSYDHATMVTTMAAMCGCETIVIPDGVRSVEEVIQQDPLWLSGIAWGCDDCERARATRRYLPLMLDRYEHSSRQSIAAFVEKCKERWGT